MSLYVSMSWTDSLYTGRCDAARLGGGDDEDAAEGAAASPPPALVASFLDPDPDPDASSAMVTSVRAGESTGFESFATGKFSLPPLLAVWLIHNARHLLLSLCVPTSHHEQSCSPGDAVLFLRGKRSRNRNEL